MGAGSGGAEISPWAGKRGAALTDRFISMGEERGMGKFLGRLPQQGLAIRFIRKRRGGLEKGLVAVKRGGKTT